MKALVSSELVIGLVGLSRVEAVVVALLVVEADDVDRVGDVDRVENAAVHRGGDRAAVVERLHRGAMRRTIS